MWVIDDLKTAFSQWPQSGISVLVVGGGLAGLSFGIEATRKGHKVQIIERRPDFDDFGDLVGVQSPVLHTMNQWPGFVEEMKKTAWPAFNHYKKYDGTPIGIFPIGDPDLPSIPLNRLVFHALLHRYATDLGIPIKLSTAAVEYFETEEHGGVRLADGSTMTADLVVAADGIGSKSRLLVVGSNDRPVSTGLAIYRASFPVKPVLESNPVLAREFEGFDRRVSLHIGPGAHILIGKLEDDVCWLMTHKDERPADDPIMGTATVADALPHVEGWTPVVTELVKATPTKNIVDWRLMFRDPQTSWASPAGRVVQIGDAAHPFLPTSGSGATMGIEDALSLAACLQLSGKADVPLGARVHSRLRFERVVCAQKMCFKISEKYHKTDWEAVAKNPKLVGRAVGDWVFRHDPEQYAVDNYGRCVNHLIAGASFANTNMPPGYVYKPWTVGEMLRASEAGHEIVDEGDWS
ncbi:hypothetical protein CkaCkLH20_12225 [Colletotrichum karsti]|uniref:FAD-binding domain-containing protein n=1 Tax=Colletotrichum karsti TaxID=1095194 RepID=A0A9P6HTL0_9PEZI|nr:uncharacterized protein CkaCkLH20_12225 [Colletotrichum karsti]KAF9870378.1 hypothetical protein CkaCkLH20_12225 [Colletotrichum karsti]